MRRTPPRLSFRALHRPVSLVMSALMVGGLIQAAASPAAAATGHPLPGVPRTDKPVAGANGLEARPRKLTRGPRTPAEPPRRSWPKPGTATVEIPGHGSGRAGDLPLRIAPPKTPKDAVRGAVEARLHSRGQAERAGVEGLLFTLEAKDRSKRAAVAGSAKATAPLGAGRVAVTVDYAGFAQAYGGGYASRLRLVELPACALTTPAKDACRKSTPLATRNDTARHTLTANTVSLRSGAATVLAAAPETGGEKGDFKATSLSSSATWSTELNTGDFTWSYDMPVPDVPGDLAPEVGLDYSSGSIDGRTGSTNNQGSWVGDGFELSPGFIERRYKPCAEDGEKNADGNKPGDLCWSYDNAYLTFNGKGGELVPVGNDEFKLQQDDGTRIAHLTSTERGNGDNDGEYWRLTTPDGTRYYFGYHRLPGWADGKETTDSTWTVPVFGNNTGEPCHASDFAGSWCQQAWRWNLDYVVDTHGNAMGYHYAKETNSYGRNLKADADTPYVRGGYLQRIDYGLRSSRMFADKPPAQVVFDSAERCLPQDGVTCAADTIDSKSFYWYDTPWDLNCKPGTKCDNGRMTPSFWTRKRLTAVTTQLLKSDGSYGKVDSWQLSHRWGMADTDYQLLLDSVRHSGHTATPSITLPKATFAYTQLANRLDRTGDGYAPFVKARLSTVADESGGQIDVNYSAPACDADALPTPETNTTRCFPQYIGGDSSDAPDREWFNKYVVTSVTSTDRTGGAPDQVTVYDYLDGAAWHFDEDGLTKEKYRTWSQWRGYGRVRVQSGGQGGAAAMKSQEEHYFLRGMDGDRKTPSGGTKSVTVALGAGEGDAITDHGATAGFEYRTVTFDRPGGKILQKTVNRPWHHETARKVRDWGTVTADFIGTAETKDFTSLDDGAGAKWRTVATSTSYDTVAGRATQQEDLGDVSTADDDQCTRTTYATNTDKNILLLPARVETVAKACDATVDRTKDVIDDVRTAYDGGAYGAAPTKGDATGTAPLKSNNGNKATYLEAGATYDDYGRELTVTDLTADVTVTGSADPVRTPRTDGRTTTTAYIPATGLPTQTRTTTPPADAGTPTSTQTTVKDLDPLRGLLLRQTDTNNNVTNYAYDALGRSTKVWLADRTTSGVPTYEYAYSVTEGKPVSVATKLLDNDGGQITSYKLYDGFLRERQSQAPGPDGGRVISDIFYDERGLTSKVFAPYFATGSPVAELFKPADALGVESQTRTFYDGMGRQVEERQIAGNGDGGTVLSTKKTIYGGDRTTLIPPVGDTTVTSLVDARGNITELRQHHTRDPESAYDTTTYDHTPSGDLLKVTDPAGNSWSYTYDQLGHQTSFSDPDRGRTDTRYDDHGQVISSTDQSGTTLFNTYDGLGRKTELREGSATGKLRVKWTYDTVSGAKGQLAESIRYVDGQAYTTAVTAYDRLYRPAKTATVIPASEGALAGTYQSGTAYKPSGLVASLSYSAAGSLPGGSINYTYEDRTLRPISVYGQGMTSTATYSQTGKPLVYDFGLTGGGKKTQVTNTYEFGTQRLATTRVDREGQAGVDQNVTFRYDEAGNVLSLRDVSRTGTDNQCFAYDYLRRLTEAWAQGDQTCADSPAADKLGGPAPYWQSYSYDKAGNRLTDTLHDIGGATAKDVKHTYEYPPAGKPKAHQLSALTTQGPAGTSRTDYVYDETGNTTDRGRQHLDWDAEGLLTKVTQPVDGKPAKVTEYLYDANGNRLIDRTGDRTTLHLGHTDVSLDKGASKAKATRYIDLGSGHQAVRADDGSFSFTLADHHGTGLLAVAATDLALTQRRVTPFGESRGTAPAAWPGTKGFVGGIDETKNTGLTHLGAREYDAQTGRFLSVDPVMDLADPQQMNGYTYGNNNPLVYADPDGKFFGLLEMFKLLQKTIEFFLNKVPNKNPGFMQRRAKAPAVHNNDLRGTLAQIYPKKEHGAVFGNGKLSTAIIHEFNTGKQLPGKKQLHIQKGWSTMKALSNVLDKDRKAREEGKAPKNLLSDSDLKIAKAEAAELWDALNSRDVTGNIKKVMKGDAGMEKSVKTNFEAVAKTPAVKDLTGTEFKPTQYKGPQPVGQPTRLRGFSRTLGLVGGIAMAAQAPSYVHQYGWKEGAWEMTKDIVDPFGFHEALEPPKTSGGMCPPESCA